jgi:hypothetical protein
MTADHDKKKTILEHADGMPRSLFAREAKTATRTVHFAIRKRGFDHAEHHFGGPLHEFVARSARRDRIQIAVVRP